MAKKKMLTQPQFVKAQLPRLSKIGRKIISKVERSEQVVRLVREVAAAREILKGIK